LPGVTVQDRARSLLRDGSRSLLSPLLRRLADLDTRVRTLEGSVGGLVATQAATKADLVEVTSELRASAASLTATLNGVQARYDELLEVISQQNAVARKSTRRSKEVERQVSLSESLEP
jgi:hypothetical protein